MVFWSTWLGKNYSYGQHFSNSDNVFVDLLCLATFDDLTLDFTRFNAIIDAPENLHKRVMVDGVQGLPRLLDVAQAQIQKGKRQFILTGSSSRRLKQMGSNLLAERAWVYAFFLFSSQEFIAPFL